MKKITLLVALLLLINHTSKSQTINCSAFCVLGITIDTTVVTNHLLKVNIYCADTSQVNYPIIRVTNSIGDTVANIDSMFFYFAQIGPDTLLHAIPTTLNSFPSSFTGMVYITDGITHTTCSYPYPMNCTAGISEIKQEENSLRIFPNPSTNIINIDFDNKNNERVILTVYGANGQLVKVISSNNSLITFNREGLTNGIYFVIADIGTTRLKSKLVIE